MLDLKHEAHRLVHEALRRGELKRPSICENCGLDTFGTALVAHHPDYSRPLDVEWLCYPCHGAAHGGGRLPPAPWPAKVQVPANLMTPAEAADAYGVSPGLIRTCVALGLLKRRQHCRRDVVLRSELERVFARSRAVRARTAE